MAQQSKNPKKRAMAKLLKITPLLLILLAGPSQAHEFDTAGFELINHFSHEGGTDTYHYHYRRWSILFTSPFLSASVVSNYDFGNATRTPMKFSVSCIEGKYWINISTNHGHIRPESDFYHDGLNEFDVYIMAGFDDDKLQRLQMTDDYGVAWFKGDQSKVFARLERANRLHVEVVRVFSADSGVGEKDVFEVAGASKALVGIKETCRESGR